MKNLVKKVQDEAYLNRLWNKGDKIVIGVSGGPDSICLLDVLAKLREKYELKLWIAHVNYGLRGRDSEKDEELVRKLAKEYEVGFSVSKFNKTKTGRTNENNLRDVRYDFFEKVRKRLKYDLIAVAHNQDDQAETFFLHLIRGAGLQGLSGMRYKSGKIIRPLLGIPKKEILEYLKDKRLRYRIDKTNKASKFFRNKVRNKLIPLIERSFNSNIKKTIADSALNIAEDLSLFSELSKKYAPRDKEIKISRILKLHTALQRRIILEAIKKQKGNLKDIESAHIDEIFKVINSSKSKSQTLLFQGLKIVRRGDRLSLTKITK
jgi:tRNA(Ile)-lysidine synthase